MKIVITGVRGLLGHAIAREFGRDHDIVALDRNRLDITNSEAVRHLVSVERPEVIVNCAAYNDVDGAEANAVLALGRMGPAAGLILRDSESVWRLNGKVI